MFIEGEKYERVVVYHFFCGIGTFGDCVNRVRTCKPSRQCLVGKEW